MLVFFIMLYLIVSRYVINRIFIYIILFINTLCEDSYNSYNIKRKFDEDSGESSNRKRKLNPKNSAGSDSEPEAGSRSDLGSRSVSEFESEPESSSQSGSISESDRLELGSETESDRLESGSESEASDSIPSVPSLDHSDETLDDEPMYSEPDSPSHRESFEDILGYIRVI